ncbi:hypothetical protein AAGW05_08885 [Arthrobacter sp. LAPM80]|uniref:hypothetical protein n=1 Tax=Arthrobacter sp. LAPM80 TaxID=3141788 RepID=UPI00398B5BDE
MIEGRKSAGATSNRKFGLRHAASREWYIFQVDLCLDGRIPGRQRKRILADLRESIDADAEYNGLREALDGLGRPQDLAASYLEERDRSRPLWAAGVMAAVIMLVAYWLFFFTYARGMLGVATQAGGEFHTHFFPVEVVAFSGDEAVGIGWTGSAALWFPLALAVLAFITASRAWRVFRLRA